MTKKPSARIINKLKGDFDKIVLVFQRLKCATEKAEEAGTWDVDGPLDNAIWRAFETMLNLYDPDGWVSWYLFDNDCGAGEKYVVYYEEGQKRRKIKVTNTRALAKLVWNLETNRSIAKTERELN